MFTMLACYYPSTLFAYQASSKLTDNATDVVLMSVANVSLLYMVSLYFAHYTPVVFGNYIILHHLFIVC